MHKLKRRSDLSKNMMEHWIENTNRDVFLEWKSKYHYWKAGFKIFYGPVKKNPKLMIISQNPGGGEYYFQKEDFKRFENGDFSAPKTNSYLIRKNRMAKRMQDLFSEKKKILEESVTFPILFFRSKDFDAWKAVPKKKRLEMEQFCYSKVKEIFNQIKPNKILILGFGTDRILKKNFFAESSNEKILCNPNNRKLAYVYYWKKIPIFCMIHPTGSRIRNNDWTNMKQEFHKFLDN